MVHHHWVHTDYVERSIDVRRRVGRCSNGGHGSNVGVTECLRPRAWSQTHVDNEKASC